MKIKFLFGKNSIKVATYILVVTLFISNILGVLRDHFLAQKIPTDLLDTYFAAFRIPDFIFNILILGAISAAFIPIFSSLLVENKDEKALKIANTIISTGFVVILLACVILYFIMPYLIPFLTPHFSQDKINTTISISRLLLLSPLIFSLSYSFSGILNSYKKFLITSLAPLIYNLFIILGTILFSDRYGVYGPVIGVIVGAFFHMLIQLFPLYKMGLKISINVNFFDPIVKRVIKLMIPRSIGLGANHILLIVFTAIASGLEKGAISMYSLADNIQTMPTVVFGTSVATALFPTLSQAVSLNKVVDITQHLQKAILSILYYLIPISVAVILLRIQLVRLILGSGHFGWEQTILTADTLGLFAVSLVFSGLIPLFAKTFYAYKDTKTPTYISIVSIIVSITGAIILTKKMDVMGLALAFSVGSFINASLLFYFLNHKIEVISKKIIFTQGFKIIIASIFMAIAIQWAKTYVGIAFDLRYGSEVLLQFIFASSVGLITYFIMTWVINLPPEKYQPLLILQLLLKLTQNVRRNKN